MIGYASRLKLTSIKAVYDGFKGYVRQMHVNVAKPVVCSACFAHMDLICLTDY